MVLCSPIGPAGRAIERFAQLAAVLAIHDDVDVGIGQARDVAQVAAQREAQVDLGADALDQPTDLGQI